MVTILSAVICLHHMCAVVTIPTPVSFSETTCAQQGYLIALQHAPKNWRVVEHFCQKGVDI